MEVQEPIRELQEQELPLQFQVQEQARVVLLLLERLQVQVLELESLLRGQAQVLSQVEAQVLDLALESGLRQAVLEQGQVVLVKGQEKAQERVLGQE